MTTRRRPPVTDMSFTDEEVYGAPTAPPPPDDFIQSLIDRPAVTPRDPAPVDSGTDDPAAFDDLIGQLAAGGNDPESPADTPPSAPPPKTDGADVWAHHDEETLREAQAQSRFGSALSLISQGVQEMAGRRPTPGDVANAFTRDRAPVEDAQALLALRAKNREADAGARAAEARSAQQASEREAQREFYSNERRLDREARASEGGLNRADRANQAQAGLDARAAEGAARHDRALELERIRQAGREELARLRSRPRRGDGGGRSGATAANEAALNQRAADLEAALERDDYAAIARLTSSDRGADALQEARALRSANNTQGRADQSNARWVAQRLDQANIPAIREYHRIAAADFRAASDAEIQQTIAALATGAVPSTRLGQSLTAYMQPLRQQTFGATLTGYELASFRNFVGNQPINMINPAKARILLGRFLAMSRDATEAEARNIERGGGQRAMARRNAPVDRSVEEPGEATNANTTASDAPEAGTPVARSVTVRITRGASAGQTRRYTRAEADRIIQAGAGEEVPGG